MSLTLSFVQNFFFIWLCFFHISASCKANVHEIILPPLQDKSRAEINMSVLWREEIYYLEENRQLQIQILNPERRGVYPVILFSGGWNVNFRHYSYLLQALAAKGYIIINIDHYYHKDSLPHSRSYDEKVTQLKTELKDQPLKLKEERFNRTKQRALNVYYNDIIFVLRNLATFLPVSIKGDLSKIALMGHSLGGNGVKKIIENLSLLPLPQTFKTSIKACIALDSRFNQLHLKTQFEKPTLLLGAGEEYKNIDPLRQLPVQHNLKIIILPLASHVSFMDFGIYPFLQKDEGALLKGLNTSACKDTLKLINKAKTAPHDFFNGTPKQLIDFLDQTVHHIDQFLQEHLQ